MVAIVYNQAPTLSMQQLENDGSVETSCLCHTVIGSSILERQADARRSISSSQKLKGRERSIRGSQELMGRGRSIRGSQELKGRWEEHQRRSGRGEEHQRQSGTEGKGEEYQRQPGTKGKVGGASEAVRN